MKEIELDALVHTAIIAAKTAGNHAITHKARRTEVTQFFKHDAKLVLDVECQDIAESVITKAFPDHAILGEEGEQPQSDSDYEWIIDPIDGTMNYTHGVPYWCVSIAVRHNGTIVAGAVFAPEFNELYTAHINGAALLNGAPLQVSETTDLKQSIIFTGISKHMERDEVLHFNLFKSITKASRKVRINGSAALDLCHVAAGNSDGYFETSIYLWDHAAAGLIAQRAGATLFIEPLPTEPHACSVICANASILQSLKTIYSQYL